MEIDTDVIRRALKDPAYMTALATRLIKTGQMAAPCAREDYHLTAPQRTAVLAIGGGPGADDHILQWSTCPLPPRHSGPHYAILRYLGDDRAVWIRWLGPLSELVTLAECKLSTADDHACPLFAGHDGTCPAL
ncbi:hypothetical protein ACIQNU_00810 [Streptomyces sp. NPDC091292]|uniref:hypothetical protein n=1 Tax=Streptomyces sp. NPDC091292 TaxID=3365991 RepID=UPI00382F0FBA